MVAVPVSQLRASQRKGSKLLLCHVHVCSWLEFSNCMAELWWTHQTCRCPVCWIIQVEVCIIIVLEQMDVGPET